MKKLLIFMSLLMALFVASIFFYAKPQLEKNLLSQLSLLGFNNSKIIDASINLDGIKIDRVKLDQDGFDFLENVKINLSWPQYLIARKVENIAIGILNFSSLSEELIPLTKNISLNNFNNLDKTNIEITKIIWDISTANGAIRVEGNAKLGYEKNQHTIKALISAQQHQLSFTSEWSGFIDANNNLQIDTVIDQLGINYSPIVLNRGIGWLSLTNKKDGVTQISGQLDGGSGSIYNVPVKNINLTLGTEENYYPILLRAQASGIEGVNVSTDIHYSKEAKDQAFMFSLNIDQPNDFFSYLTRLEILDSRAALSIDDKTNVTIQYMPEKRFADGPIPFDISVMEITNDKLKGTFLIYPSSLDLRGTAEGDKDFIKSLQSIFDIKNDEIIDTILRIDGNLKSLL